MTFHLAKIVAVSLLAFYTGCGEAQAPPELDSPVLTETEPTPPRPRPTIDPEFMNAPVTTLCARLGEIKKLPYRDRSDTDPIYEALIARGDEAFPCLIERIPDSTRMRDPREAPVWQYYAVGDTAVFVLVRSIGRDDDEMKERLLKEMLPQKYRDEWETNGVYAYFNYVSDPKNRKELQRWWKNWLIKNKRGL